MIKDHAQRGLTSLTHSASVELLDALPTASLITDQSNRIIYANPAYLGLLANLPIRLGKTDILELVDPRDRDIITNHLRQARPLQSPGEVELRLISPTGEPIWTRWFSAGLNEKKFFGSVIHSIDNISDRKASALANHEALAMLSVDSERARVTLECIGDAVISTDSAGKISYMNPVAEQLTGWSRWQARGLAFTEIFRVVHSGTRRTVVNPAQEAIDTGRIVQLAADSRLLRIDGSELEIEDSAAPILDSQGQVTGAVVIFRDRQFSRTTASRMSHLARHDHLTGLVNRVALQDHFEQAIKYARRRKSKLAVIFIDLDRFKSVNDALGHDAGDKLLQKVAAELKGCVRESDTVCRYGGDEFLVLLGEICRTKDAIRIAEKVSRTLHASLECSPYGELGLSLGVSIYPLHGKSPEVLIQRADMAMYSAKAQGGGVKCFDEKASQPTLVKSGRSKEVRRT
ncbi:MAG: diguanylate cyclase domain-containing protein [Wenzhouxiangella sp.]